MIAPWRSSRGWDKSKTGGRELTEVNVKGRKTMVTAALVFKAALSRRPAWDIAQEDKAS